MTGIERLRTSVSAWIRRHVAQRRRATFGRSQANLDAVMDVRASRDASSPRTRVRTANVIRSPGRSVDWPGVPPAEWRRRMYEHYLE